MAASAVVVGRVVAAGFSSEIQARLAHNLAGCDELAETFLVSESVAGPQRATTSAGGRSS